MSDHDDIVLRCYKVAFVVLILLSALCFASIPLIRACIIPLGSDCRVDVAAVAGKAVADLAVELEAEQRMTLPLDFDITIEQSGDGITEPRIRFYVRKRKPKEE